MAPFRRGKTAPRNGYAAARGDSVTGGGGRRGKSYATNGTNAGPRKHFQASRIEDRIEGDRVAESEVISATNASNAEIDEDSSDGASSESDAVIENPYNVLLQTLNPRPSRGEPQQKRRRTEQIGAAVSTQSPPSEDADVLNETEEEGSPSEERSDDGSRSDESLEGKLSMQTTYNDT